MQVFSYFALGRVLSTKTNIYLFIYLFVVSSLYRPCPCPTTKNDFVLVGW